MNSFYCFYLPVLTLMFLVCNFNFATRSPDKSQRINQKKPLSESVVKRQLLNTTKDVVELQGADLVLVVKKCL